jgi:uncharacterized protein DUF1501
MGPVRDRTLRECPAAFNRRQALGGLSFGVLGLGLSEFLNARAQAAPNQHARAKACIFIFLNGGASHIDVWDMKPEAPVEVRGEFKPIATSVPGIQITEHLPLTARLAHQLTLVRSLQMPGVENSHPWGFYYMHTGHPPDPARYVGGQVDPRQTDWPFLGSVVAAELHARGDGSPQDESSARRRRSQLPAAVQLPWIWDIMANQVYLGNIAGRLGRAFDPLQIRFDPKTRTMATTSDPLFQPQPNPARWETLGVPDLMLPEGVTSEQFMSRRYLLGRLEDLQRSREPAATRHGYDRYQEQAYALMTSPEAKRALAIEEEPDAVRDRYGRSINGQSALMCRRLVEAGIPFVNWQWMQPREYFYNWDTHIENFRALKDHLLPLLDQALSALLTDLAERGLLDETLVVISSDMGRTPRVGDALSPSGRNHWNFCQTAVLAGGGIRGGQVYGRSDKIAAYPIDGHVRPEHIAATVYEALGIYDNLVATDSLGRPYHLLEEGHPLPLFES